MHSRLCLQQLIYEKFLLEQILRLQSYLLPLFYLRGIYNRLQLYKRPLTFRVEMGCGIYIRLVVHIQHSILTVCLRGKNFNSKSRTVKIKVLSFTKTISHYKDLCFQPSLLKIIIIDSKYLIVFIIFRSQIA